MPCIRAELIDDTANVVCQVVHAVPRRGVPGALAVTTGIDGEDRPFFVGEAGGRAVPRVPRLAAAVQHENGAA